MNFNSSELQKQQSKLRSRGVNCDMTPEAILRRLDIVDELRELARDLQNAKRLGSIHLDQIQLEQSCPAGDDALYTGKSNASDSRAKG
jgi:hypothetical protein